MDGILLAVGGFIGATFGSLVAGYFAELYRQRNRLQLAAVEKRLEIHQECYAWVLAIAAQISTLQDQGISLSEDEKFQKKKRDAIRWLQNHYLYLGREAGQKFVGALKSNDLEQFCAARDAIKREAGLPSLSEDWWPFEFLAKRDQQAANDVKSKAT